MFKYLFVLGHQPDISTAEIQAIFSLQHTSTSAHQHSKSYLLMETKTKIAALKLINILGGTIKISESVGLTNELTNYLVNTTTTGKIEFSISGGDKQLPLQLKKELKLLGRSVRYIEPKNTATILYNKLVDKKTDLTIVDNEVYATVAIQLFEEMAERDFGRPGIDDKSGMLPPKLARMMINLAQIEPEKTLLDPFCGSGTVLTEALSMGYTNIVGSDISDKAINDSKKNILWLKNSPNFQLPISNYQLLVSDSTKLTDQIKPESIDAIVTEPYLGQPLHGNESEFLIKKQITELTKLYLDSFKEFHKILKNDGVVVIVIPKFKFKDDWIKIKIENEIEKIGFMIVPFNEEETLLYHRPNQHLAREIWRFKKS